MRVEDSPRNDVVSGNEQIVADLFAATLELESVDLGADFFDLGGDSLKAAELMTAIEQRFGIILSISVLLEASSPRALAEAILDRNAPRLSRCLASIKPNGTAPTIFYVHGNTGQSTVPQRLSLALGNRAFYAFRAMGIEEGEELLTSVHDMAEVYTSAITEVLPTGPLVLLGHCGGSIIVYEMAQRLAAAGRMPRGLIMIDPDATQDLAPYLYKSGLALSLLRSSWRKRAAELESAIRSTPNPTSRERQKLVNGGILHAIGTYVPQPYDGAALLLYTAERSFLLNEERGFPSFVKHLQAVQLSSEHSGMFDEALPEVSQAIDGFLERL